MFSQVEKKGGIASKINPQIADILKHIASSSKPAEQPLLLCDKTAQMVRDEKDILAPFGLPGNDVGAVVNQKIDGPDNNEISVRIYTPYGPGPFPVLVFFHGGCWVFCNLDSHDSICRYLCNNGKFVVVSVDYRLAPESKFPQGLEDAYKAVEWSKSYIDSYLGDPEHIAVAGDSAGGNIATVVTQMARDRRGPNIDAQLLIYPITDISKMNTESHRKFSSGYFFETEILAWSSKHYISHDSERCHPYVSPLVAHDLKGLPATLIQTAEFDILRDEGESYGKVLISAGVDVKRIRYNGMVHAFLAMAGAVEVGKLALDDGIHFLKRIWMDKTLGGSE